MSTKKILVVWLVAAGTLVVVIAVVVLLYLSNHSGEGGAARATATAEAERREVEAKAAASRSPTPTAPSSDAGVDARPSGAPRDHRDGVGGNAVPFAEPPPGPSPVAADLVAKTRLALRPVVRRCADENPSETVAGRAGLVALVEATIADGTLTFARLDLQPLALPDPSALAACVERGLAGFALPVPGHADVPRHRMRFPFDFPLR